MDTIIGLTIAIVGSVYCLSVAIRAAVEIWREQ